MATIPEDLEAGLPADGAAEEVKAAWVFFTFPPLLFFIPATAAEAAGNEGTTGEAGGKGLERSYEGTDLNRASEEDDVELLDLFFLRKKDSDQTSQAPKGKTQGRLSLKLPGK